MKSSWDKTQTQVRNIKCDVAELAAAMIQQSIMREHQEKLRTTLVALTQGTLEANVGQILELSDLELIIKGSKQLNGTLYAEHPELLFRVGKMVLMNFTDNGENYNFHFVLAAPHLKSNTIYQMYEPIQVPVEATDGASSSCMTLNVPNNIFRLNGKFYTSDLTDCLRHNALEVCLQDLSDPFSPNFKEIPCLGSNITDCKTSPTPCSPTMKFTRAGALVYSKDEILGLPVNKTTKLDIITAPNNSNHFVPWKDYALLQTGQKIMYSLDDADNAVELPTWKSTQAYEQLHD